MKTTFLSTFDKSNMTTAQTSDKAQKLTWEAFGSGILMASAAIGGLHLVSSTQAGALYGWQLAIMIVLANFFKYPFYRFGTEYAHKTGDSLVAGYAKKSKVYLWAFFWLICRVRRDYHRGSRPALCDHFGLYSAF